MRRTVMSYPCTGEVRLATYLTILTQSKMKSCNCKHYDTVSTYSIVVWLYTMLLSSSVVL